MNEIKKTEEIKVEELGLYARIVQVASGQPWKLETTPIGLDGAAEEDNWGSPEHWADPLLCDLSWTDKDRADAVLYFLAEVGLYAASYDFELGELSDLEVAYLSDERGTRLIVAMDGKPLDELPRLYKLTIMLNNDGSFGRKTMSSVDPWELYMKRLYEKFVKPDGDHWRGPCTAIVHPMIQSDVELSMGQHGSIVDKRTIREDGMVVLWSKGYWAHGF